MAAGSVTVEVRAGPILGAATDLLADAQEFAELIPDWHETEREKFLDQCRRFCQLLSDSLEIE